MRGKIKKPHYAWGMPALMAEIRSLKPKIIVTLGKGVFELLSKYKVSVQDVEGAFFDYEDPESGHQCILFPTDEPYRLVSKTRDIVERMLVNFREVQSMRTELKGGVAKIPRDYRVIRDMASLKLLVDEIIEKAPRPLTSAFDCEIGEEKTYLDGQLPHHADRLGRRQDAPVFVSAGPSEAATAGAMPYEFDGSYKEAGAELTRMLDAYPGRILAGHMACADMPWWQYVLGVDCYQRIIFDTMFGLQCVDEASDLKLERLSVMFTDLGRYDLALQLWKKQNKLGKDDGYASVPDDILLEYSMRDSDCTWRCVEPIRERIRQQGIKLWLYWQSNCLPFCTDGFTHLTMSGLPMNRDTMDELRRLFLWARELDAKKVACAAHQRGRRTSA